LWLRLLGNGKHTTHQSASSKVFLPREKKTAFISGALNIFGGKTHQEKLIQSNAQLGPSKTNETEGFFSEKAVQLKGAGPKQKKAN